MHGNGLSRPGSLDRLRCPDQHSLGRGQVGGDVEAHLGGQLGALEEAGQFGGVVAEAQGQGVRADDGRVTMWPLLADDG